MDLFEQDERRKKSRTRTKHYSAEAAARLLCRVGRVTRGGDVIGPDRKMTDLSGMYSNARVRVGGDLVVTDVCYLIVKVGRYLSSLLATVTISHYASYRAFNQYAAFNLALLSTPISSTHSTLLTAKPLPSPSPIHCHKLLQSLKLCPQLYACHISTPLASKPALP